MMTIEEQKLAVCQKLPELIRFNYPMMGNYWWIKEERSVKWSSEGLQVCHEAEKLLRENQFDFVNYTKVLWEVVYPNLKYTGSLGYLAFDYIAATHEQRLETLCRVWFPEKWKD